MRTDTLNASRICRNARRRAAVLVAVVLLCLGLACGQALAKPNYTRELRPTPRPHSPSSLYDADSPSLPAGAVTVRTAGDETFSDDLDNYDEAPVSSIADPLEPWNRFWFAFNDIFYLYIADPVYSFYETITPVQFRRGMANLYRHLLFPTRFVNNLLQFRFKEAGVEFGRFIINTVAGFGVVDVAKREKTIVPVDPSGEDFGQTLGRWGIGHGCYLVLPFLGPSSLRDGIGRIGDCFTDPMFYVYPWELAASSELWLRFNTLDELLPTYISLRDAAVDPYISMREAYVGYRRQQVIR